MEGPRALNQTGETETLWGIQTLQTTQQPAGSAVLLSVQSGAAVVYVREALTTFFDPFSQIANNIYQYVAETRIALATAPPWRDLLNQRLADLVTAWVIPDDERDYRADPSVRATPVRVIKKGEPKMVTEDKPNKSVKVKVSDRWAVVHDGTRYANGDTVTVPEHVADEWERNHWVQRVVPKPKADSDAK